MQRRRECQVQRQATLEHLKVLVSHLERGICKGDLGVNTRQKFTTFQHKLGALTPRQK
jgi:hypothetical protein